MRVDQAELDEFGDSILQHLDVLYGVAKNLTRDAVDAEDLVQEALLKAYRFRNQFQTGTNLKAWLLRILVNTHFNQYRQRRRAADLEKEGVALAVSEGLMNREALEWLRNPVDATHRAIVDKEIQKVVTALPEDYRLVLLLADVEELSYREIASVLGCPVGTVMSRLFRARRAVQGQLIDHARAHGIVKVQQHDAPTTPPVQLDAYRRRKENAS